MWTTLQGKVFMEGELANSSGLLLTLTTAAGGAVALGISMALKRFGIVPGDPATANSQAQKDMLDWQRDQLKDEVARREKAEDQVQKLLEKLNVMSDQMSRLEFQNQQLQVQVETLRKTVEQIKNVQAEDHKG
jgi:predicted nuclease with TOPRIM domain